MNEKNNDGGQAFPVPYDGEDGMMLSDYFAGVALQGFCNQHGYDYGSDGQNEIMAMRCYKIAQAMLKARGQC